MERKVFVSVLPMQIGIDGGWLIVSSTAIDTDLRQESGEFFVTHHRFMLHYPTTPANAAV